MTHQLTPGTGAYRIRILLAPLCLCLVAFLQISRVYFCHQTPWKGGGFGMFSTVDQRSARYLRIYLVNDTSRIPIDVPVWIRKRAHELRAAPSPRKMEYLARQLTHLTWVDMRFKWSTLAARAKADRAEEADHEFLSNLPAVDADWLTDPNDLVAIKTRPTDDTNPSLESRHEKVLVELWQYAFDSATCRLHSKMLLVSEVPILAEVR